MNPETHMLANFLLEWDSVDTRDILSERADHRGMNDSGLTETILWSRHSKIRRGGWGKSGLRGKNSQHAIGRAVHVSKSVIADFCRRFWVAC